MEPQQLATKVAQLESRVATLEDEGKIVKGEVKQILTEIRTAILVRDNPFETEGLLGRGGASTLVAGLSHAPAPVAPEPQPEQAAPTPEPIAPVRAAAEPEDEPAEEFEPEPDAPGSSKEPIMLRPVPLPTTAPPAPEAQQPQWSLLTIAGLSAWAEEAMRRLGPLRLEILLDLCEAAGHIPAEARIALARVTELDIPEPTQAPSTNETVVILRQLDALVSDEDERPSRELRRA